MTQPKVVGHRVGFWEGWDVKSVLILLVGPIFVLLAVRSLLNHGSVGYTALFAAIGLGATAFSIWALVTSPQMYTIVSPCPICGARDTRLFGYAADKKRARPVACTHCLAYLRVNPKNLEVREESNDAVYPLPVFTVLYEQFWSIVPHRDDEDATLMLEMPMMCSLCSSADARFQEEIGEYGVADVGGLATAAMWRATGNLDGGRPAARPSETRDRAVKHLKRRACEAHTNKRGFLNAVNYSSGALRFASYRYYKEFCALNSITLSPFDAPKFDAALPDAVARPTATQSKPDQRTGA